MTQAKLKNAKIAKITRFFIPPAKQPKTKITARIFKRTLKIVFAGGRGKKYPSFRDDFVKWEQEWEQEIEFVLLCYIKINNLCF
ncbi:MULTISPECIES: hypothetical protein [Haemophilus]|nr:MULTISPECIES: hypothetical protein [Haemophilus]NYA48509.1 hypothetical protein [Haemophilus haemolyticus]